MGGLRSGQHAKALYVEKQAVYCLALLFAIVLVGCGESEDTSGQIEPTVEASVSPTAVQATPSPSVGPDTPTPTVTVEVTVLPPTEPPPAPSPTAQEAKWPALPPPPPKPESPLQITTDTIEGGSWYRLGECGDFYAPPGWTFRVGVGIADPGGAFMNILEETSGSVLSFLTGARNVLDPALGPVFDQILATYSVDC